MTYFTLLIERPSYLPAALGTARYLLGVAVSGLAWLEEVPRRQWWDR